MIVAFCAGATAGILTTLAVCVALRGSERQTIARQRRALVEADRQVQRWKRTAEAYERQAEQDNRVRLNAQARANYLSRVLYEFKGSTQVRVMYRRPTR